jgi:hypothetical protein
MSRVPWVAGVGGGVGTSTVAAAVGGRDRGVFTGRGIDVLVCRSTGESLLRATRAAPCVAADGLGPPVLAVSQDAPSGLSRPTTARLRLIEPYACAVVLLPFVPRWREVASPVEEARDLLTRSPAHLPRPLRDYAAAIGRLAVAITASPRFQRAGLGDADPARHRTYRTAATAVISPRAASSSGPSGRRSETTGAAAWTR